jgi:hypothetical protein
MTTRRGPAERFSLSRWSRRKLAAATEPTAPAPASAAVAVPAPATVPGVSAPPAASELPPVESLTFDSDFTAFLRPGVDAKVKRAALKQLFRDPRFNVMDGLDTYIDDYTKADPIAPDVLADLLQRGFDRVAGSGVENAPAAAPSGAGAATSEPAPVDTPPHPPLSPARGGEGEQAKRSAGEGDIARAGDGEGDGAADAGGIHGQR